MSYPLGVDVGTTYTAAALWHGGRVQTVPLGNRANAIPSVLYLRADGTMLVGEAAVPRGIAEPDRQARAFKRRMGDDVPLRLGDTPFLPQELTARILRWTVDKVAERQDGPPSHVVLTHPAEWQEHRRGLLVAAAESVRLPRISLLPEPVAAATWYAAQERVDPGSVIGVYDFGGGTFDASLVRKTATGVELFGEPGGDDRIGGVDFDHALLRHVASVAGVDLADYDTADPAAASALGQLFAAVVDAKEALSSDVEAVVPVVLPGLTRQVLVTRAEFEGLIRQRLLGTVGVFTQVIRRAGVSPADLHTVLLVGGSSRIPLVRELLTAELGIRVALDAHPKHTVSLGAAIAAAPRVAPGPAPRAPAPQAPVAAPDLARPPAGPSPVVAENVDLRSTGLTTATDVAVPSALESGEYQGKVAVRTSDRAQSTASRGWLRAAGVLVLVAAVVVGVVLLADGDGGGTDANGASSHSGSQAVAASEVVATATLSGAVITAPKGSDAMRAAATLPSGDLVAVGLALNERPRAWLRTKGKWRYVEPPLESKGAMLDVAADGDQAVAVGWTGTASGVRAAVWRTSSGRSWELVEPADDFRAGSGIRELTAVTAAPGGGFLAAADDRGADADGDVSFFTSVDGISWTREEVDGMTGPGQQVVHRMLARSGGEVVAVGDALSGARLRPVMWTYDGESVAQASVPAGAMLTGIAERDGDLLVCGQLDRTGGAPVNCWVKGDDGDWGTATVETTDNSPEPALLYGLTSVDGNLTAVGAAPHDGQGEAAVWKVRLEPAQ